MTLPEKDDDLEKDLGALFDQSAAAPSDAERGRFLDRARLIGRSSSARARFVWAAPALAAAAAVLYLVAAPPGGRRPEPAVGLGSAIPSRPAESSPSPPAVTVEAPPSPAATEPEDPVAAVLGGDDGELDPLDLGPLMGGGPRANDEGNSGMKGESSWSTRQIERGPR